MRIVHTKQTEEAVLYVLRVEDVETGLQWVSRILFYFEIEFYN